MSTVLKFLPTFLAVLCSLGFLPWALGVPGSQNDYARGWTIGFYAIVYYLGLFLLVMALKLAIKLGWLPLRRQWLDQVLLAAVAGFVVAQVVAWMFILR